MLTSNSDILARHLKQCDKATDARYPIPSSQGSVKQSRAKTACDRCASGKIKCDSQEPCRHCKRKGTACNYTRSGYSDPYSSYRVDGAASAARLIDNSTHATPTTSPDTYNSSALEGVAPSVGNEDSLNPPDAQNIGYGNRMDFDSAEMEWFYGCDTTFNLENISNLHDMVYMPIDIDPFSKVDYQGLPYMSMLEQGNLERSDNIAFTGPTTSNANRLAPEVFLDTSNIEDLMNVDASQTQLSVSRAVGLSIAQLDPVEAKCTEMRELLGDSTKLASKDIIDTYINRSNLVSCTDLYVKYFQPNVPIVHIPTFQVTEASPILLLSMVLVGACYAKDIIPMPIISRLAMRLLGLMNDQSVRLRH